MDSVLLKTGSVSAPKCFGPSVLTPGNVILPDEVFEQTPSQLDGMDMETETDLRILGCEAIQSAGILLRLPQPVMASAQIYFQRYYYRKSFVRYPYEDFAMGCLFLASKVEEHYRESKDILNVFNHIKQVNAQKTISPLLLDAKFEERKKIVLKAEGKILKELGFCVFTKHAYKLLLVYCQFLYCDSNSELMQMAFNYMNDAVRTDVFLRYNSETIACACIFLAARKQKFPLPNQPHWFLLFSVTEDNILSICVKLLKLYERAKVNLSEINEKIVILKKKRIQDDRCLLLNNNNNITVDHGKAKSEKSSSGVSCCSNSSKTSENSQIPDRVSNSENGTSTAVGKKNYNSKKYSHKGSHRSRSRSVENARKNKSNTPPANDRRDRMNTDRHHRSRSRSTENTRKNKYNSSPPANHRRDRILTERHHRSRSRSKNERRIVSRDRKDSKLSSSKENYDHRKSSSNGDQSNNRSFSKRRYDDRNSFSKKDFSDCRLLSTKDHNVKKSSKSRDFNERCYKKYRSPTPPSRHHPSHQSSSRETKKGKYYR